MTESIPLYPGDTGELGLETRRALVQLLKGPLVTAEKHPEIWRTIIRDERVLRSRLADVFLDLVVDENDLLAFTRPADTGDHKTPTVLRTERLTFMDTAMVLALRHRLLRAQPGERVIVDFDEVTAQLEMYRGATSTDPAGFRRRVHSSWEKLKKYSLLASTSTEGRMEVSPVLRQLFDADQVAAVEAEFRRIVEGSPM
ncbi:DUF4194 domain-containing protein [Rhodococcus sp. NPDC003382]|uniref:DUF4194 domain-containing protein n=1 Tax=unclassified Rhodococcus (in: high G+C Gram-positive bacteria) TaxID=192944 RepID=UPI0018CE1B7E|nr:MULTISPECIES: DUF4194 domain-containing protein [unclassified Rhodococcus (in: high G+C Gram-positive bacteria)]MBH0119474.1 DUF4194 domain-containing protein [Rhodococcus sp. CX]MCK8673040.1 DUF4194 domain-containing protein [Rhodococcus sp. HM1]